MIVLEALPFSKLMPLMQDYANRLDNIPKCTEDSAVSGIVISNLRVSYE